ncbi:hypothetical protein ES707_13501 [subsurface metagenome]
MTDELEDHNDDLPPYRERTAIAGGELVEALSSLQLMDNPYLSMQIHNLAIVDQFIMELEEDVLQKLWAEERTPPETMFLSAQSQMWIFAAYELMRTWREMAKDVLKLHKNGGLKLKIEALKKPQGFVHVGREIRAEQLQRVMEDKTAISAIEEDLRLTHIPFGNLEFVRISIAKHQVPGKAKQIAYAPGYGRINQWCGSLDYQLECGRVILGQLSRRDIADQLRAMNDRSKIPTDEEIDSFDEYMEGYKGNPFTYE